MEGRGGRPMEVEVFGKVVKNWKRITGGWVVEFDWDRNFDSLIILRKGIAFYFDSTRQYVASVNVVRPDEMDEAWKKAFYRIVGAQAAVSWEGLISRKPVFSISSEVEGLKRVLPDLKPDADLVDSLNADSKLTKLMSQAGPEELRLGPTISTPANSAEMPSIYGFTHDPPEINWTATFGKYVTRGLSTASFVNSMVDIMDIILGKAKSYTLKVKEEIQ